MKRYIAGVAALAAVLLFSGATAMAGGHGGGHDPVTICHKPGTPAQQTLIVDDDSVELTGHLGHGDTIGPCQELPPPPKDVCKNIDGIQESVPEGYFSVGDYCFQIPPPPPTYTVCHDGETLTGLNLLQKLYHLAHGDTLGACEPPPPPIDYCDTLEGVQAEDEDCPPPVVDVCPNIEGVQESVPEGMVTDEQGNCVRPTPPPPPHETTGSASVICDLPSETYVLSGEIDGQAADSVSPATLPGTTHGWTNVTVHKGDTDFRTAVFTYGDCHAATVTPPTTTAVPPAATVTPPPTTSSKPPVKAKPKPKPRKPAVKHKAKPKPDNPPVKKVKAKHVCKTLNDGTKRAWWKGGNGLKAGCYPVIQGSG